MLVEQPAAGFEKMTISGLIQCVGIVIEARDPVGRVVAAAGAHFVTPDSVTDGAINPRGAVVIAGLLALVNGRGTLSALLMTAEHEEKEDAAASGSVAEQEAGVAAGLIKDALEVGGVVKVGRQFTESGVTYQLTHLGVGARVRK